VLAVRSIKSRRQIQEFRPEILLKLGDFANILKYVSLALCDVAKMNDASTYTICTIHTYRTTRIRLHNTVDKACTKIFLKNEIEKEKFLKLSNACIFFTIIN
jgi:hypothetical protein